jgi:TolA-binding protein
MTPYHVAREVEDQGAASGRASLRASRFARCVLRPSLVLDLLHSHGLGVIVAIGMGLAVTMPSHALAKPKPVEDQAPAPKAATTIPSVPELQKPGEQPQPQDPRAMDVYRAILRSGAARGAADTLGDGMYHAALQAFYDGQIEAAQVAANQFARTYVRNLKVNEALEIVLLAKNCRDFDYQPLRAYGRVLSLRASGHPDSAAFVAKATLQTWPGAAVRYHLKYQLADLARERGDHAEAVAQALAVADSTSKSRLAPSALKLAGDETLAMGQGTEKALKIYQELLERFPDSPLTPGVRSQVLDMRKKLQL